MGDPLGRDFPGPFERKGLFLILVTFSLQCFGFTPKSFKLRRPTFSRVSWLGCGFPPEWRELARIRFSIPCTSCPSVPLPVNFCGHPPFYVDRPLPIVRVRVCSPFFLSCLFLSVRTKASFPVVFHICINKAKVFFFFAFVQIRRLLSLHIPFPLLFSSYIWVTTSRIDARLRFYSIW